jgi:hypothetical protein
VRPSEYEIQDYSFNFVYSNFIGVCQIMVIALLFYGVRRISMIKADNWFLRFLRARFQRTFYTSALDAYLSCHITLTFSSVVVLLDRYFT